MKPEISGTSPSRRKTSPPVALFKGQGPERFSDGGKTTGLAKSISAQPLAFVHCRAAEAMFADK